MDIGKAFSYQFEDSEWLSKLGLGGLISLVPILNFAWQGYLTEAMHNVSTRRECPLPAWNDLGKNFSEGAIFWIARLLYALPGILLLIVPFFLMIIPALANDPDVQGVLAAISGGITLLLFGLWMLYLLALSFLMPAVRLHFARVRTFSACFQVKQIFALATQNLGNYLTAWVISIVAGIGVYIVLGIVSSILSVIPCIGFIFALLMIPVYFIVGAWMATVFVYLFGQAAS